VTFIDDVRPCQVLGHFWVKHPDSENVGVGEFEVPISFSRAKCWHVSLDSMYILYRSTVFWTLAGLKLCCISESTSLLMSYLGRGFVAMPSNQPGLIVLTLELVQRQAECFHGIKGCEP